MIFIYTFIFNSNSNLHYVVFEINKKFNVLVTSLFTLNTTRICDNITILSTKSDPKNTFKCRNNVMNITYMEIKLNNNNNK